MVHNVYSYTGVDMRLNLCHTVQAQPFGGLVYYLIAKCSRHVFTYVTLLLLCKLHCLSGADSVGHPLSAKELLVLKDYILPEDVIESLQQEGLDLQTIAIVQTTIEEVQRRLDSLGQSKIASSLRQRLDFGKHL